MPSEGTPSARRMNDGRLARALISEALGTAFLVAAVIGSGIMAESLAAGNTALALLANAIATGAILVVLILSFGPVSGAHFNPAVTLAFLVRRDISARTGLAYAAVQIAAGIGGTVLAHAMFDQELFQWGSHARTGIGQWIGEITATFALVFTIIACVRHRPEAVPYAVGLVITAGYWYTSSTSFANPAVTIARAFTDSFASIAVADMPAFVGLQLVTALATAYFANWLFAR
jgi:glycerol uptake facilitator-like aquaporin